MGRPIPVTTERPSNYHLLYLSFFLACMAAVIAVTSAMCGTRSQKKRKSKKGDNNNNKANNTSPQDKQETLGSTITNHVIKTRTTTTLNKPLPPPPAAIEVDRVPLDHKKKKKLNIDKSSSLHNYISGKASRRRLSTGSIGMHIPIGHSLKHKELVHKTTRLKQEESLWTKKILLGEKCRLHEEGEEGEEDKRRLNDEAAVSYGANEKGKWVCSLVRVEEDDNEAMSMSNSSVEEDTSLSLDEWMSKEKESDRSSDVVLEDNEAMSASSSSVEEDTSSSSDERMSNENVESQLKVTH